MTPDQASELQAAYRETRAQWAESVGFPFPKRRVKRRPEPGELDVEDPENG